MHAKKTLGIAAALLAGALTVTGCGNDTAAGSGDNHGAGAAASAATAHNRVDIRFAEQMIPHHGQAIDMAKMAKTRAGSARVKKLAVDIEAAQGPEIARMTGLLKAWGSNVPSTSMGGMPGMHHSSGRSMPGMMTSVAMHRLGEAHGAAFDRMFLQMMIRHHQGALAMAKTEKARGKNPHAVRLAESIQASQSAQIAKMRRMLNA